MSQGSAPDVRAWWRDLLTPHPEDVGVPLDHRRSKVYSARRATLRVEAPENPLFGALADPARRHAALLGAVFGVLFRTSGTRRLSAGTPAPLALGGEPNALTVAAVIVPEMTCAELFEVAERAARESYTHAQTPFAEVVAALGLEDVQNRNPLFGVAVRVTSFHGPLPDVRNDVTLEAAGDGPPSLTLDYSARLYQPETIERFGRHVLNFLGAALADPARHVRAVDYLSPDERRQLIHGRDLAVAEPIATGLPATVHEAVAAQAARTPQAEALLYEGRGLTYAELNRRANRLAHALAARGAEPGKRVGLCLSPSGDMLVALLAILKTGAAAVPLDGTFPSYRLGVMIEDAGLDWIVTETALTERLPGARVRHLCLDTAPEVFEQGPDHDPPIAATGEDLVYVLYTSGSTGRPKGVCMPHRALVNLLAWQRERSGTLGAGRTLQRTSVAFDVGFQEVFSTWIAGGCLVVAPEAVRSDVSLLPGFIAQHGIARAFLPPVSLQQLAESAATQRHSLERLKEINAAGEQLRISLPVVRFFREVDCALDNQYGPTETHVATAFRLAGPSTRWPALPPIGRPLPGVRVYLLDEWGEPVPLGVVGEIHIAGTGLARGYLGNDQATSAAFVADPHVAGERMYRTGDLGRRLHDGTLEFAGRRDHQVKVRGYRIELGDIEATLLQIAGVQDAAVTAWEDEQGDKRLVAYLVTRAPDTPSLGTVRDFLQQRLPAHMVPAASAILRLPSLPLTSTGKVDRKSLPPPDRARPELAEYTPSRNVGEEKIAAVWARTLGLESVGVHDDFVDLGGHSLLAIKIVSEINDLFGITLPLAALLRGGTVASVAARIDELLQARARGAAAAAPAASAAAPVAHTLTPLTLPGGLRVVAPHAPEAAYLYVDVFEHHTYRRGGVRYPPGGTYFDVGANIGLFTLYALEHAPGARVCAFEPAPPLVEALRRNTEAREGVSVFPYALGEHAGTGTLTYYPTLTGMSSLYPNREQERALLSAILKNLARHGGEGAGGLLAHSEELVEERLHSVTFPCELRTLSQALAETGVDTVDLLKIDVQKAELDVLRGVAAGDWPRLRQVVVEVHDFAGQADAVAALLRGRGFTVAVEQDRLHEGAVIRFVYAVRPAG